MHADALEHVDQVSVGIDLVQPARHQQSLDDADALFADTVAGANASARLYSLIECAKANELEPYAYLRHVFTELPKVQSLADIEALLPTRLDPAALARDSLQGVLPTPRQ